MNNRTLRMGGDKITLKFMSDLRDTDDTLLFGEYSNVDSEIRINADFPKSVQKEALLHEMIHCVDKTFGLGLDERMVRALAHSIFAFIDQNDLDLRA